ncbi:MAG: hypothetical protein U1E87_09505 [Alphaproteobacteria bacterium]
MAEALASALELCRADPVKLAVEAEGNLALDQGEIAVEVPGAFWNPSRQSAEARGSWAGREQGSAERQACNGSAMVIVKIWIPLEAGLAERNRQFGVVAPTSKAASSKSGGDQPRTLEKLTIRREDRRFCVELSVAVVLGRA